LAAERWQIETLGCDASGVIDPDQFASRLRRDTRLACVQLANPVLGTIQPVREIADACHHRGVPLHCDATQAFGKLPVDVTQLRADTVAISGHKFYGPKGSGALYVRRGLQLNPICFGEPREMGLRPGAENIPGCVGLGAAAAMAAKCCGDAQESLQELRDHFANAVHSTLGEEAIVLCEDSPRLPNTLAIELPGDARRIQRAARQVVLATAQSDAPADEMTRALQAIGRSRWQIGRTIRLSMGWTTSREQVDRATELLAEAWDSLASR